MVRPQTFRTVVSAETLKLWAPGGIRVWIVVAGVLGCAAGVITALLSRDENLQAATPVTFVDVLTSGAMVVSLILSLAACHYVPREITGGVIITSKYLVPRSGLLFAARVCSWLLVSLLLGIATAVLGVASALTLTTLRFDLETLPSTLVAVVLSCSLVALAHAGAAWLQRGAVIVAVGMTLLFVLPVGLGLVSATLPGAAGEIMMTLSRMSLGAVLMAALQVPTALDGSLLKWGLSVLGLIVWLTVTLLLALRVFCRPGYGDS